MDRTFYNCSNLAYINLPQNLINVTNAKNLFDQCIQLKEINLNNFNGNHKLMNINSINSFWNNDKLSFAPICSAIVPPAK